ncbi:uncharacterized protein LOC126838490 isoform X3 [Adelges cooleyi]|uniref:uncharacterized protein LOC126838490 isoform X3 n=1 Tax=Adelges cooleyi TaxID=133065 RepID=UPI00217FAAB6|nr:uncharacterized protein LOC126838490 isoform X3 [Adelges cooleyi]
MHAIMNDVDESSYILRHRTRAPSAEDNSMLVGPDGDWGWYVVGGCAFVNFLLVGMLRTYGPNVLEQFVEKNQLGYDKDYGAGWIPSTFNLAFYLAARINDFMFFDLVYAVVHRREVSHDSLFSVMMKNMVKKKKKTGKKKPKHVLSLKCEETLDELESLVESSVGSSVESLVESSDESSVESLVESSDESSVESSSNQPTKLL